MASTAQTETKGDGDRLIAEIRRYLDAVDTFRLEGCAPRWLPEPTERKGMAR